MDKRKWKVKQVEEFMPSNESLLGLNVNRGGIFRCLPLKKSPYNDQSYFILAKICIRLRYKDGENFLVYCLVVVFFKKDNYNFPFLKNIIVL